MFVLPADANLNSASSLIPLADVLDALGRCAAKHKLLVLDIMQPLADARLGILGDDVAGRVQDAVEKSNDPNLLVLLACSRGQVSLASEELGRSVFDFYLAEGMAGRADGFGPKGNADNRITAQELADFVRARVDRWARQNRDRRQTPILIGTAKDFPLRDAHGGSPTTEPPAAHGYPDWLLAGWKTRDDWLKDESYRLAPGAFRQSEDALLRAESRWRGGFDEARVHADLSDALKDSAERLAKARAIVVPASRPKPRSLAAAHDPKFQAPPELLDGFRKLVADDPALKPPPAKPEEAVEARTKFEAAKKEYLTKQAGKAPYVDFAWTLWNALVDEPAPSAQKIRLASGLLQALDPPPPYVEVLLLRSLSDLALWPEVGVPQLLTTVRDAEKAHADDPAALLTILPRLSMAADKRRQGEKLLLTGSRPDWPKALDLLKEAQNEGYAPLNKYLDAERAARAVYDQARARLPGHERQLAALPGPAPRELETWDAALKTVAAMQDEFMNWQTTAEDLLKRTGDLQIALDALARPLDPKVVAKLTDTCARIGGPSEYAEAQNLLASPRLSATERQKLWEAARDLALRQLTATLKADADDKSNSMPADDASATPSTEMAIRRARLSIDLLQLAGVDGANRLKADLNTAKDKPLEDNSWLTLGNDLRTTWRESGPKQLASADDATADRWVRILGVPDRSSTLQPTANRRLDELRRFWKWQGEYFKQEAKFAAETHQDSCVKFFEEAEQEYLRFGR